MPGEDELEELRVALNGAWKVKEYARRELDKAWEELQALRTRYDPLIDWLREEHDATYKNMKQAFLDATNAFTAGRHDEATLYFEQAKELQAQLPRYTAERQVMLAEINRAQARHRHIHEMYITTKERFLSVKASTASVRRDVATYAGVPARYIDDVEVKMRIDGEIHIYFGGVDGPLGRGHAHYVLDKAGNIEYRREPFQRRGPHNFLQK